MASRPRLVAPDERAADSKPKTIAQAAKTGTPRELLVSARDVVAARLDNPATPAHTIASLTKRLFELVHDIEQLDARAEQEAENAESVADGDFDASAI